MARQLDFATRQYDPGSTSVSNSTQSTTNIGSDMSGGGGLSDAPSQHHGRPDFKRKLVVVGDGGCGKTCLLITYYENRFPEAYIPTVFQNYVTSVKFENKVIELALWDTAGQEEYDRLRPLSYPDADILLVCFAVDYPVSLENVEDKWFPEIQHFCDGTPFILVGNKIDLRQDQRSIELLAAQGQRPVATEQGKAVARKIGALYAETSAKTGFGIRELFQGALKESLKNRKMKKMKKNLCQIL